MPWPQIVMIILIQMQITVAILDGGYIYVSITKYLTGFAYAIFVVLKMVVLVGILYWGGFFDPLLEPNNNHDSVIMWDEFETESIEILEIQPPEIPIPFI